MHQSLVLFIELALRPALLGEELNHAHAGDVFGEEGVYPRDHAANLTEGVSSFSTKEHCRDDDRWQGSDRDKGQANIQQKERNDHTEHHGNVLNEVDQYVGEELVDGLNVVGHTRDQTSHRISIEVCERLFDHMIEELHAHVAHDSLTGNRHEVYTHEGEHQHAEENKQESLSFVADPGQIFPSQTSAFLFTECVKCVVRKGRIAPILYKKTAVRLDYVCRLLRREIDYVVPLFAENSLFL